MLACDECGRPIFILENGVSHHADGDGAVDHDADADHVAYTTDSQLTAEDGHADD